jgi:hypothetical protein
MVQVVLTAVFVPGDCAAKSGGVVEPSAGDPGSKQADWHVAACELHVIMQVVVVELCAHATPTPPAVAQTVNITADHRMTADLQSRP